MEQFEILRALDKINKVAEEALAHTVINQRVIEAHKYCQKYLMPESWGKNVWHAILDDAIKLRKQLEATHGMGG